MNQTQAEALANVTTLLAKMSADPVIVRYNKLKKFAESVNLRLDPKGQQFEVKSAKGQTIFECDTTEELNTWFGENYMEDVL